MGLRCTLATYDCGYKDMNIGWCKEISSWVLYLGGTLSCKLT